MNEQEHLLVVLAEEADEAAVELIAAANHLLEFSKRCHKALRFGMEEVLKGQEGIPRDNAKRINDEINDIMGTLDLLVSKGYLELTIDPEKIQAKGEKILKYMKLAVSTGALDPSTIRDTVNSQAAPEVTTKVYTEEIVFDPAYGAPISDLLREPEYERIYKETFMTAQTRYPLLNQEQLSFLLSRQNVLSNPFADNIVRMNEVYKLPINTEPTLHNLPKPNGVLETAVSRMTGFLKTLADEVSEGLEIKASLVVLQRASEWRYEKATPGYEQFFNLALGALDEVGMNTDVGTDDVRKVMDKLIKVGQFAYENPEEAEQDILTDLADWLGDIMVYCRSEATKFGIPLEDMLIGIMGSNFTKLSSDGIPKHDANGKFLKDMTNFIPPERALKTLMFGVGAGTVQSVPTPLNGEEGSSTTSVSMDLQDAGIIAGVPTVPTTANPFTVGAGFKPVDLNAGNVFQNGLAASETYSDRKE